MSKPESPAAPALDEAARLYQQLQRQFVEAGKNSRQETARGFTTPSPQSQSEWQAVLDTMTKMYAVVVHFSDGGAYDASDVTAHLDDALVGNTTVQQGATQESSSAEESAESDARDRGDAESGGEPSEEEQLKWFTRSLRNLKGLEDTSDEVCRHALELWRNAHRVGDRNLAFYEYPGRVGTMTLRLHQAAHGSAKVFEPVPQGSEVEWHQRVWEITSGKCVRYANFANPRVPLQQGDWVTKIDVVAQFLAAASAVHLGHEVEPTDNDHGGPWEFVIDAHDQDWPRPVRDALVGSAERPGYVRLAEAVDMSEAPEVTRLALQDQLVAGAYLPTPMARYLAKDRKLNLKLDWALVWIKGRHGQHLAKWSEIFRTGRKELRIRVARGEPGAAEAYAIAKNVYASYLGGMTRSTKHNMALLRPDHHDQYVALASANALRSLEKAAAHGYAPLCLLRDTAIFADPKQRIKNIEGMRFAPDPDTWRQEGVDVAVLAEEHSPGKWAVEDYCQATPEIVQAHTKGRTTQLKALVEAASREEVSA
ncbi:hypothetical protein [Saccharopolyspora griseoalba]|uniref:Uncharacterized protein n=1 Tax=Saccharopolyspora griseoalba TaxID=1431848 RepID=A0ABW2LPQ7_9PSEU